jgi:LPXTG-site transpeptidase (sortase) family protein
MGVIVGGIRAARRAWSRKWSFSGLFLLLFLLMYLLLAGLDLLPEAPLRATTVNASLTTVSSTTPSAEVSVTSAEAPVKVEAKAIGLSATIANPSSTKIDILDSSLLKGAVRYPTSAQLNEEGNVVLFGHSSYLPLVKNPAYKTFNDIQKLKEGDTIIVYSSSAAYTYVVREVVKEVASEGAIPLDVHGKVLTLSTCNSFATKNDRFVVTADFVESHPLGV